MVPPDCPGSWLRLTGADQAPAIGPAFSQEQRLFSTDLSGCPHLRFPNALWRADYRQGSGSRARMAVDVVSETVIARPPGGPGTFGMRFTFHVIGSDKRGYSRSSRRTSDTRAHDFHLPGGSTATGIYSRVPCRRRSRASRCSSRRVAPCRDGLLITCGVHDGRRS